MQQQQPLPLDITTLSYHVMSLEQHVQQLQNELRSYVPIRENDLQLQSIRSTVERIERDVQEARKQITDMDTKVNNQGKEQDRIQISVLRYAVATVIVIVVGVVTGVLVFFLTHP